MKLKFPVIVLCVYSFSAFSANVAMVKLIRGDAEAFQTGKSSKLKVDDWVSDGAVVKTAEKSFVKLVFIDKSQMNIGPSSEMKIEKFDDKDSGVIDLVKGKIRSQVTKDYLQIQDKDKSKLFIKTKTAVLGVRGTDFMVSTNGQNTATVLFEGEVVFNKLESDGGTLSSAKLEEIVDQGVRIMPGEFSVVDPVRPEPSIPSVLNVQQRENLEKNVNFEAERAPSSVSPETKASIVPPGLDGAVVSNTSLTIKTEIASVVNSPQAPVATEKGSAAGFVNGDQMKPANGSFVHIDSGVIIPPDASSVLDKNTNTYISTKNGTVGADGNYVPPKNVEITNDGKVLVSITDKAGVVKVQEVPQASPVVTANAVSLTSQTTETSHAAAATAVAVAAPRNDIINKNFVPSGLSDISNNQRNVLGGGIATVNDAVIIKTTTDATINVHKGP
jgi:FecR protein